MQLKQIIAVRKDLGMRKGKCVTQGAHAAMQVLFDYPALACLGAWRAQGMTKITVAVDSEMDLLRLHAEARREGLPTALIQDLGHTEFHGVKTFTAIAIGPADAVQLDRITGDLPLL